MKALGRKEVKSLIPVKEKMTVCENWGDIKPVMVSWEVGIMDEWHLSVVMGKS